MVESERLPEPDEEEDEDDDDYTDRDEGDQDEGDQDEGEGSEVEQDFQAWQDRLMEEAMARASRAAAGIPEFDEAAHALWVMRTTFERLDDGESIDSGGPAIINQKVALPSLYVVRNRANSL